MHRPTHVPRYVRACCLLPLAVGLTLCLTPLRPAYAAPAAGFHLAPLIADSEPDAHRGSKLLTLQDLYGPGSRLDPYGELPYVERWLRDGAHYLEYEDNSAGEPQLMKIDARTGRRDPFYDAPKMQAALAVVLGPENSAAAQALAHQPNYTLDATQTETVLQFKNDLYLYRFGTNEASRLTESPGTPKDNISFSPDGRRVAYVRGHANLYVVDVDAPGGERALTHDGPKVLNGRLDWIYEEELYGRGNSNGYTWSPDSRSLLFLRLDETPVKPFAIVDHLPVSQPVESELYPKPGDPNPIATLGIAAADGSSPPRFVDVSKYPANDRLIVRFAWTPDSKRVVYQVQNRVQTFLDLNAADASGAGSSAPPSVNLLRELTSHWVDVIENPVWLKDGSFLWPSDRSGHRHIYLYRADGTLVRPITAGDWDIRTFFGVDPSGKWAYFSSSEHNPITHQVYRISLRDSSDSIAVAGNLPQRLTLKEGDHQARFDPTFHLFLDEWSNVSTPAQLYLIAADTGETIRIESQNSAPTKQLAEYNLSKPEFLTVKAHDGFSMEAMLIKPPNFDPKKKYPVFCPVYGGPGMQTVVDRWDADQYLLYEMLAEKGYVIWLCDNRSASGKGEGNIYPVYRKFGEGELSDIEDGLDALKEYPWVDAGRIGISGWSFGGFLAEYALTHSKSFRIGISGAGVSDWRLYDSIYTERYMDTPQANPGGYRDAAPINAAAACSGKLLLIHGTMDDNVHLQNTVDMVYALEKAGKDFDLMLYPGPNSRHDIVDPQLNRHLQTVMYNFILKNL